MASALLSQVLRVPTDVHTAEEHVYLDVAIGNAAALELTRQHAMEKVRFFFCSDVRSCSKNKVLGGALLTEMLASQTHT